MEGKEEIPINKPTQYSAIGPNEASSFKTSFLHFSIFFN